MKKPTKAQKMWDALRHGPQSRGQLEKSGASTGYVGSYLHGLKKFGYVEKNQDAQFVLVKNTGAIAPYYNKQKQLLWDLNLNPPMKPGELMRLYKKSKLSFREIAIGIGHAPTSQSSIRKMARGTLVIHPETREKLEDFFKADF